MEIFTVGGAVRDELLGLPVQDRDYVVVGASPEEMLARGFKPGRQGLSRFSCIRSRTRNTRWREPNARPAAATRALLFAPHRK
jgi:hypothetical protein